MRSSIYKTKRFCKQVLSLTGSNVKTKDVALLTDFFTRVLNQAPIYTAGGFTLLIVIRFYSDFRCLQICMCSEKNAEEIQ